MKKLIRINGELSEHTATLKEVQAIYPKANIVESSYVIHIIIKSL